MPAPLLLQVQKGRQLSVFLENVPGALGRAADLLGRQGINIYALSLAEGLEHGYVRMVVDQPDAARRALDAAGEVTFLKEVLLLELANAPGSLAAVCARLAAAGLNVEYAYCAGGPAVAQGLVVVKVDDTDRALTVLGAPAA